MSTKSVHRKGLCSCRMLPMEGKLPWLSDSDTRTLAVFPQLQGWLRPSRLPLQEEITKKYPLDFNFLPSLMPHYTHSEVTAWLKGRNPKGLLQTTLWGLLWLPVIPDSALNVIRSSSQHWWINRTWQGNQGNDLVCTRLFGLIPLHSVKELRMLQ